MLRFSLRSQSYKNASVSRLACTNGQVFIRLLSLVLQSGYRYNQVVAPVLRDFAMNILTIGGATQDLFLQYRGADIMSIMKKTGTFTYMLFESGEKVEVDSISYLTGGGATNTAVGFTRLGFKTASFCALGADIPGDQVINELTTQGVDTSLIARLKDHSTGTSYIVSSIHGERTIFTHRAANAALNTVTLPLAAIATAKQLYITSLSGASARILPAITEHAKKHNVPIAINPGTSQLSTDALSLKQSLKNIDIIIMNSFEARTFMHALVQKDAAYQSSFQAADSKSRVPCGLNAEDSTAYLINHPLACHDMLFSMNNFFKEVLAMGPRIVVVTNGANGVYAASENKIWFCPSAKTTVISSVGAGDAFGSCFVGSMLNGASIEESLQAGVINSASVLSSIGAKTGLLSFNDIQTQRTQLHDIKVSSFLLE